MKEKPKASTKAFISLRVALRVKLAVAAEWCYVERRSRGGGMERVNVG